MDIDSLRKMIDTPRDNAMLRFSLGRLLIGAGEFEEAEKHLAQATRMNPGYAAAWKELGRARQQAGDESGAAEAWRQGIETARSNGDKQAEKEMTVFLRRLAKRKNP
ncbi:MAG: tetratricopeptide repeat protein [Lysobacterales bacterium]|jgi:predicted Zn-dependent protease